MRQLFFNLVLKIIIPALLGLVLFGIVGRRDSLLAVSIIIIWRLVSLAGEWMRPRMTDRDWNRMAVERMESFRKDIDSIPEFQYGEPGHSTGNPAAVAAQEVAKMRARYTSPRLRSVLIADATGTVGFLLLLPVLMTLDSSDFVSWRGGYTAIHAAVFGACLALYAVPLLPPMRRAPTYAPWLWWGCPLLYLIPALLVSISDRHPYLIPWNTDRKRLFAERLLATRDGVTISSEAHLLVDYAEELAAKGETPKAIKYCQYAVRMSPGLPQGLALLEKLGASIPRSEPEAPPHAPYFDPFTAIPKAPRTNVGFELERIDRCTVVLVSMGRFDDETLDFVAAVLTQQIRMPVLVYDRVLQIPEHTRTRGLVGGRQWEVQALVKVLEAEFDRPMPAAPLRYILLTTADMYAGDANFVFAHTFPWGAIVSSARFTIGADVTTIRHRLAKQSLSVTMKSFGVPIRRSALRDGLPCES